MDIKDMNLEQVVARMGEIKGLIDSADSEKLDTLNKELDELLARKKELEAGAQTALARKALNDKLATGTVSAKQVATVDKDLQQRKAFMNYVMTGETSDMLARADATGVSNDLGVLIPHTVQQEIIQNIESIYGSLYNKVKHLNIRGGVEYPIGEFGATFNRITETGAPSDRQKGGEITGSVKFGYNIGEIRIARTLLQSLLTVQAFEAELGKVIADAYVKAMDKEVMTGTGRDGQMEGILTNTEVTTIELTAADLKDWKAIQKKVFGSFKLGFKNLPYEFVMSNSTWESEILTLADDNNRPVYTETFSPIDGHMECRFKGHAVTLVEPDILPDFETASAGDVFGMIWVPDQAYAVNTNMQFSIVQYMDHEKNQIVQKALVVNDGKVLRPDRIVLLKKKL